MTNGQEQQQAPAAPAPAQPAPTPPAEAPAQPAAAPDPTQPAPAQPAAAPGQPPQAAAPAGNVSMGTLAQWAAAGGALAGVIQAVFGLVGGFDLIGMVMTIVLGVVFGILSGVLLGQFGTKIPIQGTLMIKAALFMFVISFAVGIVMEGLGDFVPMIIGLVGKGAGAFAYGWIIQKKLPNLL